MNVKYQSLYISVTASILLVCAGLAAASALAGDAPVPEGCTIVGTAGPDVLEGTSENDVICGLAGDDTIHGRLGNDYLVGGDGNDKLFGDSGDDVLYGGKGRDRMFGADGRDVLDGGKGGDKMHGGGQGDVLVLDSDADRILGGWGGNRIVDGNMVGQVPPWGVFLNPDYRFLPVGTKVEWFYANGSGHCLHHVSTVNFTHTVDNKTDHQENLFVVWYSDADIGLFDRCYYESSYATWQVRITTPTNVVKTGSIYIETGLPNVYVHEATASCHDFSFITCVGGSDSAVEPFSHHVRVPVQLGPI